LRSSGIGMEPNWSFYWTNAQLFVDRHATI